MVKCLDTGVSHEQAIDIALTVVSRQMACCQVDFLVEEHKQ